MTILSHKYFSVGDIIELPHGEGYGKFRVVKINKLGESFKVELELLP